MSIEIIRPEGLPGECLDTNRPVLECRGRRTAGRMGCAPHALDGTAMDDVLTLGHTGRYRIDWIRRDDGSIRYRVTGFRLDGDPEEPPRVDARPTRGGGVRLTVRRDPTPGGTVTPECLRRTAAWLTDIAGELDRMRTLLELDLDRRTGRSRPDPAKDARKASKRGPDGENTAEPARQTLRQYVHCE